MELTKQAQQSFQMAKVFSENTGIVHSMDFSDDGKMLVTSSDDDSINLYNCTDGLHANTLHSKKYGAGIVRFTHAGNTVIHTSTKNNANNDTIRYLSLHDNKYIRYFVGHKDKVTSLGLSPVNDMVLSASRDMSVRLWDLRSPNCSGVVQANDNTAAAFDPKGLVFAVGVGSEIKLYDVRKFDKGPFDTFSVRKTRPMDAGSIVDLEFSGDEQHIMARTTDNLLYVLDAYKDPTDYATKACHTGNDNGEEGAIVSACFSPDGVHVLGGTQGGAIKVWDSHSGQDTTSLEGHGEAITALRFNPKLMLLASGAKELGFWLPSLE